MLAKPLKSLGKKGKTLKIARNSLKRKKARKSKKARKRRLGISRKFERAAMRLTKTAGMVLSEPEVSSTVPPK